MPRSVPLQKSEAEIGRRLMAWREDWKLTRRALAQATGVDRSAIQRVEIGRVPLKFAAAVRLQHYTRLNPLWLATGTGPKQTHVQLPSSEELGINGNESFLSVFTSRLSHIYTPRVGIGQSDVDASIQPEPGPHYRRVWQKLLEGRARHWMRMVPNAEVDNFAHAVQAFGNNLLKEFPSEPWDIVAARVVDMDALDARWKKDSESALDTVHAIVNSGDVKAQWPILKKRLQKATEPFGKKSKLAEFLDVKLASVSQWLSDSESQREPGAETTLRLLNWVEQQERQAK